MLIPRPDLRRDHSDLAGFGCNEREESCDSVMSTSNVDVKDSRVFTVSIEVGNPGIVNKGVKRVVGRFDVLGSRREG